VCEGDRLLSGESLASAARAAEDAGADAVLVNCTTPADTGTCLAVLRATCRGKIGAYPNLEDRSGIPPRTHVDRPLPAAMTPPEFGELVAKWRAEHQPDILGGCCGTTPAHLAAARDALAQP
jgi:S-methylmethionine-dependent homocysteine/selenocysteine methylase